MPPKRAGQNKGRGSGVRAAGGDADEFRAPFDAADSKEAAGGSDSDTAAKDEDKRACGLPVRARWLRVPSFYAP